VRRTADGAENTGEGCVTKLTGKEPVSLNMWGFTPHVFPQLEESFRAFLTAHGGEPKSECYIPMTVGDLVKAKRATCEVLRTSSSWFGATYAEDKPLVQRSIRALVDAGEYPVNLWG
jgi:hypothetical protein